MKSATIGLLLSWALPYLAGVFITLDYGWMNVFAWSNGDRAFFLFLWTMSSFLGITLGSAAAHHKEW